MVQLSGRGVRTNLLDTAEALNVEVLDRAQALANWIAGMPEVRSGAADFTKLCVENRISEIRIKDAQGVAQSVCHTGDATANPLSADAPLGDGRTLSVWSAPASI